MFIEVAVSSILQKERYVKWEGQKRRHIFFLTFYTSDRNGRVSPWICFSNCLH